MDWKKINTPLEIINILKKDKITLAKKRNNEYNTKEHREVWERHKGKIPKGMLIHHINKNKKDNRIENLQMVSIKEHGILHQKPNRIRIKYPSGIRVIKNNHLANLSANFKGCNLGNLSA